MCFTHCYRLRVFIIRTTANLIYIFEIIPCRTLSGLYRYNICKKLTRLNSSICYFSFLYFSSTQHFTSSLLLFAGTKLSVSLLLRGEIPTFQLSFISFRHWPFPKTYKLQCHGKMNSDFFFIILHLTKRRVQCALP